MNQEPHGAHTLLSRRWLVVGVAAAACVALIVAGVLHFLPTLNGGHQSPRAGDIPLLPGEQVWSGVPSFDFGVNDGVNWNPNYNMDVEPDATPIQAALRSTGVPIARAWFFQYSLIDGHALSDAEQIQKLRAVRGAGMTCFANFPTGNTVAYDLRLMALLNGACPYVEVMNEPDIEKAAWNNNQLVDPTAYLRFWNTFVPQARARYHGVLFGGPAEYDNQGAFCSYALGGSTCFLQKVMQGMAASGNRPDFISYHWYPCWQQSADQCLGRATSFAGAAQKVIDWTKQYFGKALPVICSEWNADPGFPNYMFDRDWDARYVSAALRSIESSGLSGAMEMDVSQYGNWSALDLFDICTGKPFATWQAFAAIVTEARAGARASAPAAAARSSAGSPNPVAWQAPLRPPPPPSCASAQ